VYVKSGPKGCPTTHFPVLWLGTVTQGNVSWRANRGTAGGSIPTVIDEPPERFMRSGLNPINPVRQFGRATRGFFSRINRHLTPVVAASFFSVVLLGHTQEMQGLLLARQETLSPYDQDKISYALSRYISESDLTLAYAEEALSQVAIQGENIGGTEGVRPMRQYTVAPGIAAASSWSTQGWRAPNC
jgi:hypothetical protein